MSDNAGLVYSRYCWYVVKAIKGILAHLFKIILIYFGPHRRPNLPYLCSRRFLVIIGGWNALTHSDFSATPTLRLAPLIENHRWKRLWVEQWRRQTPLSLPKHVIVGRSRMSWSPQRPPPSPVPLWAGRHRALLTAGTSPKVEMREIERSIAYAIGPGDSFTRPPFIWTVNYLAATPASDTSPFL